MLKGAVIAVLGARWTASVHARSGGGRLTVQFERKPTEEEVKLVAERANAKVAEGAEMLEFEMDREEAEGHFGKGIYDLFPLPESVKHLKLVRIPEWEVNCCAERHVQSTSEVGRLEVTGVRFRAAKKLLEVEFRLAS